MISNSLPSDWAWTMLGEIITFEYGKGLREDKRDKNGNIPVYGSNGIVGYHSVPLIEMPCLIVGRKGAAGYVHISKVPSWPIDTTYYVIPPNELNLVFLYYLLSTLNLNSLEKSTAIPGLNRNDAYTLEIPLPPLPEQRAIVSKIEQLFSDLDNGIKNFKKAQAQLKRYRQSVLKAACEGRLVPTEAELARAEGRDYEAADVLLARILKERREKWNGNGKYKEPGVPDTSGLPELPEGWSWAAMEQISTKVVDGVHKKPNYISEGIPFVTVRNLTASRGIDFENVRYITEEDHKDFCKRANPEKGDILITKDGTLGVTRVVKTENQFSIFVSVAMMKPIRNYLDSDYLATFINSPLGQRRTEKMGEGSGLRHLHLEDLRVMMFPIPPLAEQHRIVSEVERRLSISDKMEATITESLQKAESLRQSILKKAFEGKLLNEKELEEAHNAPDWEPAEKLLERIRQEKEIKRKNKRNT